MTNFRFSLERVMDWRRTQLRMEEVKLEQLYGERRAIEIRDAELRDSRAGAERSRDWSTALELSALDNFRRFTVAEQVRLERRRADCNRRIAQQIDTVTGKRREVRVLERLKERRRQAWNAAFHREADSQADEAYLAKWPRMSTKRERVE